MFLVLVRAPVRLPLLEFIALLFHFSFELYSYAYALFAPHVLPAAQELKAFAAVSKELLSKTNAPAQSTTMMLITLLFKVLWKYLGASYYTRQSC